MTSFKNDLHIVAFDIPYPADYGGVIDIFYKLKALSKLGLKITLHCYQYGRAESPELKKYAHKVIYYRRKVFKNPFIGKKPYIVASRNSTALIENLLEDEAPILFEGLHSTYYLNDKRLKKRTKIVRTHNVEHDYYRCLEEVESNYFKKYFFRVEADKLKKYESVLKHANHIAAISPKDTKYFQKKYGKAFFLPPFHGNNKLYSKQGKGDFALYHGNLSVGENVQAALFLIKEVFNDLDHELIIAGNNPPKELISEVENHRNVTLKANVSTENISKMMEEAHVNVLPTFQSTGIKLKLINALYRGRYCVANPMMVGQTNLEDLCMIADSPEDFKTQINNAFTMKYTKEDVDRKRTKLLSQFSNQTSAKMITSILEHGDIKDAVNQEEEEFVS